MTETRKEPADLGSSEQFFNRELSWLSFARRVLALVEDRDLPLLERVKFAGIMGMLHDEFFMKRIGGLRLQVKAGGDHRSLDGRTADEELRDCRAEIRSQIASLARVLNEEIRPALAGSRLGILDYRDLTPTQREGRIPTSSGPSFPS
jgi:polyphosphate kinase